MVISNALSAWGPIHDNHVGIPHDVDDDADSLAINLSHMIADSETAAQPSHSALVQKQKFRTEH